MSRQLLTLGLFLSNNFLSNKKGNRLKYLIIIIIKRYKVFHKKTLNIIKLPI